MENKTQKAPLIVQDEITDKSLSIDTMSDIYPSFLIKAMKELGYNHPSNIQKLIYQALQSQHNDQASNIIAQSRNGTGKTMAYSSLLIHNVVRRMQQEGAVSDQGQTEADTIQIEGMILTPTREIAIQVSEYFTYLCKYAQSDEQNPSLLSQKLSSFLIIGGMELKEQRKKLLVEKPNIVIGTPGRIKDLLDKEWLSLKGLSVLILDEADKFCQTQYYKKKHKKNGQVKFYEDIQYIIRKCDKKRCQFAAFSATYNTDAFNKIQRLMPNSKFINAQTDSDKQDGGDGCQSGDYNPHLKNIRKYYIQIGQSNFEKRLKQLEQILISFQSNSKSIQDQNPEQEESKEQSEILQQEEQVIIFFNFRHQGEEASKYLKQKMKISSIFIHGDLTQEDRIKAFEKMRLMRIKYILSTDLLSRGIDLPDVKLVINFDMPISEAEYFHRIGRTGRFGKQGLSLSLLSDIDLLLSYLKTQIDQRKINSITMEQLPNIFKEVPQSDENEIDNLLLLGKRKSKEEKLITHQKKVNSEFGKKEQAYKKQKMQSGESMISQWKDPEYNFYDNQGFNFLEEKANDDQFSYYGQYDAHYDNEKYNQEMAKLLEIDLTEEQQDEDLQRYQGVPLSQQSNGQEINEEIILYQAQEIIPNKNIEQNKTHKDKQSDKCTCLKNHIACTHSNQDYTNFKVKVNHQLKNDQSFSKLVQELMFANYCKYRVYYKSFLNQ